MTGFSELYVCCNSAVLSEFGRKYILNMDRDEFIVLNEEQATYVQMNNSENFDPYLSEGLRKFIESRNQSGEVRSTNEQKIINRKKCQKFIIRRWIEKKGEEKTNPETISVWIDHDIDFNLEPFYQLMDNLRYLRGSDKKLRNEMKKLEGAQMAVEIVKKGSPGEKRFISEVVELSKKHVDENAFSVPSGYKRKEKLTKSDLRIYN